MLLLWGREDKMVPPKLGPLFTQYNPGLVLREIDGAGHCPQDECPEQVNRLILDWLKSLKPVDEETIEPINKGTVSNQPLIVKSDP